MDEQKTSNAPTSKREKASIHERAFIEKELLHSSMAQKELMNVVRELNHSMKELTKTLHLIEQHEFVDLHRKKWKLIAYNIFLGILFAIGTVTGLFLISWFSYNFFKDSVILRQIVENQLKIRQLDMNEMKNRIKTEVTTSPTKTGFSLPYKWFEWANTGAKVSSGKTDSKENQTSHSGTMK